MKTIDVRPDSERRECFERAPYYLLGPDVIRSFIPGKAEAMHQKLSDYLENRDREW